jgi:hypothetical protein
MTLNIERKGVDAERILNDPIYQESFAAVEKVITDALKSAPIHSPAEQEAVIKLVMRLQAVAGAKKWMDNTVQYGQLAESQREQANQLKAKTLFNRRGL